jgi:hypothetical protein
MEERVPKAERNLLVAVVAAGLLVLVLYLAHNALHGRAYVERSAYNWPVWYCGAEAIGQHRDPYRVEPLRACEHRVRGKAFEDPWAVIPMPLPGYSLALLWPLLKLPFFLGKTVWIAIVLGALVASAWVTARLTKLWFPAVLLIFAPTIGVLNVVYGGLEPPAILALCIAAFALERNRPVAAGVLCALACIEPHLGFPAAVAVFFLAPRARLAIALSAIVLASMTVALLGWPAVVEWIRGVLPEQSAGEAVLSYHQYSLAHVLYAAGVPIKIAATLGSVSYLAAIAFGTFAASRIRESYGRAAAIVLLPVAISQLGGLYVHSHQITAALPAALLLATLPVRSRWFAVAAVAVLAFPWEFDTRSLEVLACLAVCASILVLARELALSRRLALALVIPVLFVVSWSFVETLPWSNAALAARPDTIGASDLATSAWTKFLLWTPGRTVENARTLLEKIPWWFALLALACAALDKKKSPANRAHESGYSRFSAWNPSRRYRMPL